MKTPPANDKKINVQNAIVQSTRRELITAYHHLIQSMQSAGKDQQLQYQHELAVIARQATHIVRDLVVLKAKALGAAHQLKQQIEVVQSTLH